MFWPNAEVYGIFWTEPLMQCNLPLISVVDPASFQLELYLVFSWPLCFEVNSHNWESVYLHPRLLQSDPGLCTGRLVLDWTLSGSPPEVIQRKACKAALYIHHVNSKNKYEYDSILCKSYEMDSQEEYLFCNIREKPYVYSLTGDGPDRVCGLRWKNCIAYSLFQFDIISYPLQMTCTYPLFWLRSFFALSAMDELYSM